jgi:CDP-2,3-bis-(O-geranylgeranyl)-sn-glycerol synthase
MIFLLQCLYFMLPAYFANMAPVFAQKLGIFRFLAKPVDGGRTLRGKPIFGANKTWRGFVAGVVIAIAVVWLQYFLSSVPFFQKLNLLNYSKINLWLLGFLFGFGALFGDLIKSFLKRQFNLPPGAPWIPFDQLDFVIGALIFVSFVFRPSWPIILAIVLITPLLHILTNQIGYILKIKNTKW